jgi:hypothetical protein
MYGYGTVLIAVLLFVSLAIAIEVGYRTGRRFQVLANESTKAQINTIQASLLGILALLLGFTFSLALQRFDSRSVAIVDEANAIGTAYLRAQLLPSHLRGETQDLLLNYLDLRVQAGAIALDDPVEWEGLLVKANQHLDTLWRYARQAAEEDARPVISGLFIQALNELIDSYGRRNAALNRHVPEVVLFLLYGTFILTASLVGYASGVAGRRASFPTYILITLIVLLVFIIIDLDRPRRGMIEVSQKSLTDLYALLEGSPHVGAQ